MESSEPTHALVWSENSEPEDVYPNGINASVAEHLNEHDDVVAKTAAIDDSIQGVSSEALRWADALVWFSHVRNDELYTDNVERVVEHVTENGLGFVALHSAELSRPFERFVGEGYTGGIRNARLVEGETERVEVTASDHPIADGVTDFELSPVEAFEEPFDVPEPDDVVLKSTYSEGGEFRSGVTFTVGDGRLFFLRPGHETFRHYHDPRVSRVLYNAVRWTAGHD